jgi:hypothetical protein
MPFTFFPADAVQPATSLNDTTCVAADAQLPFRIVVGVLHYRLTAFRRASSASSKMRFTGPSA